jgi:hypothetical protein
MRPGGRRRDSHPRPRLLANLDFVAGLRRERHLSYLKFSFVVQDNNFREMPDFVALGRRFAADVLCFSRLANWGTFSNGELVSRAAQEPAHPNHREFLAVLCHERMRDPRVFLGSLSELLPVEARQAAACWKPPRGAPAF